VKEFLFRTFCFVFECFFALFLKGSLTLRPSVSPFQRVKVLFCFRRRIQMDLQGKDLNAVILNQLLMDVELLHEKEFFAIVMNHFLAVFDHRTNLRLFPIAKVFSRPLAVSV
jgi:hypothetical protein